MSQDDTGAKVYNATDGPLLIDAAGRVLGARTHSEGPVDVDKAPARAHVAAGRLLVMDTQPKASRGRTTQEA